jgi:hypothetical protein
MPDAVTSPARRFRWSALGGRCRRRIFAGLALLAVAAAYGSFAGLRMARRGADERAFDQPLVRLAQRMIPPPVHLRQYEPQNDRELYLVTVISDQQDLLHGLTALVLRVIASLTAGGLGLVLLTAGSTEWEIRSENGGIHGC